ncbi:MAG: hypothetical protein NZ602_17205 [Thermoguttaceae bacterium]|nr:hypothetical protein [Thermoguttaceae bacterium]MDW8039766.1 hypothetical protein [Thermoguttaceae bacterium]
MAKVELRKDGEDRYCPVPPTARVWHLHEQKVLYPSLRGYQFLQRSFALRIRKENG